MPTKTPSMCEVWANITSLKKVLRLAIASTPHQHFVAGRLHCFLKIFVTPLRLHFDLPTLDSRHQVGWKRVGRISSHNTSDTCCLVGVKLSQVEPVLELHSCSSEGSPSLACGSQASGGPGSCASSAFPVSRWVIGLIWQPTVMVYFDPKKGNFWTPPDLEWDQERS